MRALSGALSLYEYVGSIPVAMADPMGLNRVQNLRNRQAALKQRVSVLTEIVAEAKAHYDAMVAEGDAIYAEYQFALSQWHALATGMSVKEVAKEERDRLWRALKASWARADHARGEYHWNRNRLRDAQAEFHDTVMELWAAQDSEKEEEERIREARYRRMMKYIKQLVLDSIPVPSAGKLRLLKYFVKAGELGETAKDLVGTEKSGYEKLEILGGAIGKGTIAVAGGAADDP